MEQSMIRRIILAAAVVLVCSVESKAQQHPHGQYRGQVVTNRTVVNNTNVYNGGGYRGGYYGGYNNGVGMWPGSGPYDSAIAVAGIVAGASVLNNVISSARQPQVIVQQPAPVYAPSGAYAIPNTVYGSGPNCILAPAGVSPEGAPVYQRFCR
jgi:hypothetical protein